MTLPADIDTGYGHFIGLWQCGCLNYWGDVDIPRPMTCGKCGKEIKRVSIEEIKEKRLKEIEDRWAMATPRPWNAIQRSNDGRNQWSILAPEESDYVRLTESIFLFHTPNNKRRRFPKETDANARAVAAAPEDVSWLCTELRAAKKRISELEAANDPT